MTPKGSNIVTSNYMWGGLWGRRLGFLSPNRFSCTREVVVVAEERPRAAVRTAQCGQSNSIESTKNSNARLLMQQTHPPGLKTDLTTDGTVPLWSFSGGRGWGGRRGEVLEPWARTILNSLARGGDSLLDHQVEKVFLLSREIGPK